MATDLQVRKINNSFQHIDVDNSGYAALEDMQGLGARLLTGLGVSPASERGRAVLDSFDTFWDGLLAVADENKDGRLSRDEFERSMIVNFVDGDRFDALFEPAARAVVTALDLDGDGQVDQQEFKVFQDAFGRTEAHAATAFAKLDRDGDGQLTVTELLTATREYYTSADPDAVGNFLFGEPC
ncbi:EF-hand domain-containing protein [Streptomyces sp. NPDC006512]|uniref:EF-hand domain-containing protein n=1 Tax=Streptomyces sp. NPDC006512 TaxID=3154307 RepID=UPI0033AF744C